MRIRLLFFAFYRDLAGVDSLDLDLPEGTTARQAVDRVRAHGNGTSRLPAEPAVAVNQEIAGLETVLNEGDEVALLPPVAGG